MDDWVALTKKATDGRGVDVVLDIVGGDYIPRNLDVLAMEGRLLQIAFLRSPKAEVDFSVIMRKRLWVTGSTLRPRTPAEKGVIAQALLAHVWPLIEQQKVKPIIHTVLPLARAADAHRLMEASTHIGKIVLDVRGA
jgi:NADPH2:quinone reductase